MDTETVTLSEFLLARIAEDEATARAAAGEHGVYPDTWWGQPASVGLPEHVDQEDVDHIARHDPARVLADCEAKRRIVEEFRWSVVDSDLARDEDHAAEWDAAQFTLRTLALPYADHPDYRPEWRP